MSNVKQIGEVMAVYWYVLHVRVGREHKVENYIRRQLDKNVFMPFVPLHERIFKVSGIVKKELNPLFPGYVFIESDLPSQEFIESTSTLLYTSHDIAYLLRYSNTEISMRESERQILMGLCDDDHCIKSSIGFIVGDRIHIKEGPLKDRESIIRKINRHKRLAWIDMEFMGVIRLVSVALDIVEKV